MDIQSAGPMLSKLRIAVFGDAGVGKKTYIQKIGRKQNQNLMHTLQDKSKINEVSIHLVSNVGPCQITLVNIELDVERRQKDEVYKKEVQQKIASCDSVMLIFSVLERSSYKAIPNYYKEWARLTQNGLGVLIGTKIDGEDRKVKPKQITFHRKKNLQFYFISSKSSYNIIKPFQYLLKRKLGNANFQLINVSDFIDTTVQSPFNGNQFQTQLKEAESCVIPCDDSDY